MNYRRTRATREPLATGLVIWNLGQVTRPIRWVPADTVLAPNGIFGDIVRTPRRDFGPTDFTNTSVPVYSGDPVIFLI